MIAKLAALAIGFYGTKAISLVAHRGWSEKIANPTVREFARDGAVSATAVALSLVAKKLKVAKGDASTLMLAGGLFFALHRGIKDRVLKSGQFQSGFTRDLLTDHDDVDDALVADYLLADYQMDGGGMAMGDGFDSDLDSYMSDPNASALNDYVEV